MMIFIAEYLKRIIVVFTMPYLLWTTVVQTTVLKHSKETAMALNGVDTQLAGDERTPLLSEEETSIVASQKTVVAQVPIEGGGHAILVTEQVQVGQVGKVVTLRGRFQTS